jgi:sarcosine oxidase delta subunit
VGYLDLLELIQGIRNQQQSVSLLEERVESLRALATKPAGQTVYAMNRIPAEIVIPPALKGKLILDDAENVMIWRGSMSLEESEMLLGLSKDSEFQQAVSELTQILRGETVTLDVAQLESTLRNSRNSLRSREVSLRDNLDRYKISLGLPPEIVVSVDEELLGQFQFIDVQLTNVAISIKKFIDETGKLDPDAETDLELMKRVLAGLYAIQQEMETSSIPLVDKDVNEVRENLLKQPPAKISKDEATGVSYDEERFKDDYSKYESIRYEIINLGEQFRRRASTLTNEKLKPEEIKAIIKDMYSDREELKRLNFSLQVSQINFRVQLVKLNKFDLPLDMCVGLAVENRLDLMNERALVMDARRQVEVIANRLKGVVDLVVEGDIRNEPGSNNPVDFRGSSSSYRAGVAVQAPLDQAAERNAYREALINYQRAKRDYMLSEDNVKAAIRSSWRQLQILEQNLETARQALTYSALEYDQAAELANAPTRPGQSSQGGVQGRNIISAINNVLSAQNNLVGIWVDYERLRLNIYRDMDIMEIDSRGVWVDNFYQELANNSRLGDAILPPPAPDNFVIPLQMQEVPPSPSADLKAVSHEQISADEAEINHPPGKVISDKTLSDSGQPDHQLNKGPADEFQSNDSQRPHNEQQASTTSIDSATNVRRPGRGLFSFR